MAVIFSELERFSTRQTAQHESMHVRGADRRETNGHGVRLISHCPTGSVLPPESGAGPRARTRNRRDHRRFRIRASCRGIPDFCGCRRKRNSKTTEDAFRPRRCRRCPAPPLSRGMAASSAIVCGTSATVVGACDTDSGPRGWRVAKRSVGLKSAELGLNCSRRSPMATGSKVCPGRGFYPGQTPSPAPEELLVQILERQFHQPIVALERNLAAIVEAPGNALHRL